LQGEIDVSALPRIDWCFDFISPFAYLACERLGELDGLAEVHPVPVLFAGLLDHYGQRGPAEIGPKRTFTYRFALWRASRLGIPMRLPPAHPFNPLKLLRLAVAIGAGRDAVREIFRFVWRDGCSPDDPEALAALAGRLGIADVEMRTSPAAVKAALRQNGERAIQAGVFGVPTCVLYGSEVYWGEDAMDMVVDRLRGAPVFDNAEMQRAETIEAAAMRVPLAR
jgi:2-hydroxychromene-2-carboxylate isomerase